MWAVWMIIALTGCNAGPPQPYDPNRAAAMMQIMKMNNDNFNAQQQRQVDIFRAGMPQQPMRLQTTCQRIGDFTYCN